MNSTLILRFLQRRAISSLEIHLDQCGVDPSVVERRLALCRELESLCASDFCRQLTEIWKREPALVPLHVIRYLANGRDGNYRCGEVIEPLQQFQRQHAVPELSYLLTYLEVRAATRQRLIQEDIQLLADRLGDVKKAGFPEPYVRTIQCYLHHLSGWMNMKLGRYPFARRGFLDTHRIAHEHSLWFRFTSSSSLAALLLQEGKTKEALEAFSNDAFRSAIRAESDIAALIYSHLMAGECALLLGVAAKANYELGQAQDLIDANPQYESTRAYLIQMHAGLDTLWGNEREGRHLYEYALKLLESNRLEKTIWFQTKLELVKASLRAGETRLAIEQSKALFEQTNQAEDLDARCHVLVFRASLLRELDGVDGDALYDELSKQMHLFTNQRLGFMAVAEVYHFARHHRPAREQRHWLDRLQGLRAALDPAVYESLYKSEVLHRYRADIEDGLEQLDEDLDRHSEAV